MKYIKIIEDNFDLKKEMRKRQMTFRELEKCEVTASQLCKIAAGFTTTEETALKIKAFLSPID